MTTSRSVRSESVQLPLIEGLEGRCLMSAAPPAVGSITSIPMPTPILPVPISPIAMHGNIVHAEATQAFTAVVGTISSLTPPPGYVLQGSIDWGDGTATSAATFVPTGNGTLAVEGSHTYAKTGVDFITVFVTEAPPPGTTGPIIVVEKFQASAIVIASPGGVTLSETAGAAFTANVGSFTRTGTVNSMGTPGLAMTALINWGDGTTSIGTILATPEAGANPVGGLYEIQGTHTYAKSGSYDVHVTVTGRPTPTTPGGPVPDFIVLIANINSVIDVLPPSPIATS